MHLSSHRLSAERTPEGDAVYTMIREEIRFELGLINARVNWLITSQAFLLTPLVLGMRGQSLADSLLYPEIPVLGLTICVFVGVSILAAVWRGRQWRAKLRGTAYDDEAAPREFSRVAPFTPIIPWMGLSGALGVPMTILATWLWLLVAPPSL